MHKGVSAAEKYAEDPRPLCECHGEPTLKMGKHRSGRPRFRCRIKHNDWRKRNPETQRAYHKQVWETTKSDPELLEKKRQAQRRFYRSSAKRRADNVEKARKRRGWYAEDGMATDEEMRRFALVYERSI